MEPTEHRRRDDVATGVALGRERRRTRGALTNRPVWPPAVEIRDILDQDLLQVTLIGGRLTATALGPPSAASGVEIGHRGDDMSACHDDGPCYGRA
jgi:hypothetical protein